MKKFYLALLAALLAAVTAWADEPFRRHRYDGFKALTTNEESIVFIGNSITNMHEWWEAFDNPAILNRGTSGAVSDEMLDNLETVLAGRPAKIFLMIGTNDLGTAGLNTAEHVAQNVRTALECCRRESPATQIYVQSILPSRQRDLTLQRETNDSLRKICTETGAIYVDLWDDLLSVSTNNSHTLDGLHLTATGYRIWCEKIAPLVGSACVYPPTATDNACGLGGSNGMRATSFAMLPVNDGDILLIGDEMIHGGEWHELLHSPRVKSRGTGWGRPGADIATLRSMLPGIFHGRTDNGSPAKVFLYAGTSEIACTSANPDAALTAYRNMVDDVRRLAPGAEIYLMALLPTSDASTNDSRIAPFNSQLKQMADETENTHYVDIYTPMLENGVAAPDLIIDNYLCALGYARLSELLAPCMGTDVEPTTVTEARQRIAGVEARKRLARQLTTAGRLTFGEGTGTYPTAASADILSATDEAYALLASASPSTDDLDQLTERLGQLLTDLLSKINMPAVSTDGEEHWYQLYTPKRDSRYLTSNGVTAALTGETNKGYARSMWKFVERTDGTFDIVCRADGCRLNPTAAFNTALTTTAEVPATGWTISHSNTPGLYIIHAGNVQLNQTQSNMGYKVYNYSSKQDGTDRDDNGCQYAIVPAGPIVEEPSTTPVLTLRNITLDGTHPYRINATTAAEVFKHGSGTVAIDFTPDATSAAACALMAASNSDGADYFAVVTRETNKYGVQYVGDNGLEGWYTQAGKDFTKRSQMVITMDGDTQVYSYYMNGQADRTVSGMGAYGFRIFGNVPGKDLLTLGGVVTADGENRYPFAGTIHSVRFWDHVLTNEEISNLNYEEAPDGNEPVDATTIEDGTFAADTRWYTLQSGKDALYLAAPVGTEKTVRATATMTALADEYLWCFVTAGGAGYHIYNKAAGTDALLTAPAETEGTVTLAVEAGSSNSRTIWQLTPATQTEDTTSFAISPANAPDMQLTALDGRAMLQAGSSEPTAFTSVRFGKQTYNVNMTTGRFTSGNSTGTWFKTWQSTSAAPRLTLDAGYNNMTTAEDDIAAYVGLYAPQTYTLRTDRGYAIETFEFDFANHAGSSAPINISAGNKQMTSGTTPQHFTAEGDGSATASFTLDGENKGITLSHFGVTISRSLREAEPQTEVFTTLTDADTPYRIPAIATTNEGHLVAVADYRHSRTDIGFPGSANGRIDLHARISRDGGATWDKVTTIVEGQGANSPDAFHTGFGDPCIVADRESNRVLVLSCAGDVSFPAGTRQHHQGIARFESQDGGLTWSEPTDLSESIYRQFDQSARGPVKAMFIGSGKIHQSRYTKVGDTYRLYCAVLVRDVDGTYCNYVLFSDDFGLSWSILGDADVPPIPSGADEPKTEELPDGSIVISSRCTGGRQYNIYTFTDSRRGEGNWGQAATSGAATDGVVATSNSCNGEILIVPARRRADGTEVYLALQSLPFGPGRANVGIYYKELSSLTDFETPTLLAADWDGRHQATDLPSAYSTMTLQADHSIGFLYEEETHTTTAGGGYTIVYKNYTVEQLTDSAYAFAPDLDTAGWLVRCGRQRIESLEALTGEYVGMLDQKTLPDFSETLKALEASPTAEHYEALNKAILTAPRITLKDQGTYTLRSLLYPTLLLSLTADGTAFCGVEEESEEQQFVFVQDEEGGWRLYNKNNGKWIGPTVEIYTHISATNEDSAGTYNVSSTPSGVSILSCRQPADAAHPALHLSQENYLVSWLTGSDGSGWQIKAVKGTTGAAGLIEADSPNEPKAIYDLQGRRVARPSHGIYIIGKRKVVF